MTGPYPSLRRLFTESGYDFIEPPVVHPASVFVELAGEDLRRRLYLTSADDGVEMALRPDYTIPVCLHHLATGPAKRKANYAYLGPVFRIRPGESGEFNQTGVESLGRTDRVAADADMLKLAFASAGVLGLKKAKVRVGDSALFAALLDALDLSPPWQRRLERAFGDAKRLSAYLKRANGRDGAPPSSRAQIRAAVERQFEATGLGAVVGRTVDDIVERTLEKQEIAKGIGPRATEAITAFLGVSGSPQKAATALRRLAGESDLDLDKAIERLERRNAAFADHGIDVAALAFAADFGRRLDYYTGFVFEFSTPGAKGPVIGGGRYDRMTAHIGDGEAVPAVGFSIWLDRVTS